MRGSSCRAAGSFEGRRRGGERGGEGEGGGGGGGGGRGGRLPRGAEPPIRVYVNGVEQSKGSDFRIRGGEIVFERPIVKEGKVSGFRWLAMLLGLLGPYPKNATVDADDHLGGPAKLDSD